jgi:hypothetical protein
LDKNRFFRKVGGKPSNFNAWMDHLSSDQAGVDRNTLSSLSLLLGLPPTLRKNPDYNASVVTHCSGIQKEWAIWLMARLVNIFARFSFIDV